MNASLPDPSRRVRNFIISGTNYWNPGDDFVRDGVIEVLRQTFPGDLLNFHFYNFAADQFPKSKFRGIGNEVSAGDLELCRDFIDGVIVAGLSAGHEIKDLYNWVLANGLEDRVFLIGAGYENSYCAEHVLEEPEATIFRKARIIIGRTANHPGFIKEAGTPYVHLNCPALLSVPEVKPIAAGKKIQRIGFSIQLPHETGIVNQSCDAKVHRLACQLLLDLAKTHEVELIAHHKSEYFLFLHLLKDTGVPVIYSSFYQDLHDVYRRYDCVVTTRLHSSLYANGHGIPGIIVNDTDRHTHTLDGFPHSVWVNTREAFDREFARLQQLDLPRVAQEMSAFKEQLAEKYVTTLRNVFDALPEKTAGRQLTEADTYQFDSEKKEQLLVRSLVQPGMTVLDVGAHLGKYTKLFSLLVGDEGRVISFEPTPASARKLAERIESDHLTNVTLIRKAVCDHNGVVTLHQFPEEYSSWNGLGRALMEDPRDSSKLVPIVNETEVSATTLDEFCQSQELTHIDYLKLDVEGAEIHALRGAADLLSRQAVDCLQFEVSRKMLDGLGTSAREVFEFLAGHGYECHSICEDGQVGPVASDSDSFYNNYIAFPVKVAVATNPTKDLPINFFTIVLNGYPFIRHHIETLRQLPFQWHWHIIEGVAELKHDTGWSVATGGRIPDSFHKHGLSVDGTTEYLDELKRTFPDQITIHRPLAGKFWDGKREMVNAPLARITGECLLWQLDADELWTTTQIIRCRALFLAHPERTAAMFFCHYFVGADRVITSRDTYGNHNLEWLRVWRFQPGDRWIAHEPPRLGRTINATPPVDIGAINPFRQADTEAMGLVFQHYAYATEAQVRFKQDYYGYPGAVAQWEKLQEATTLPCRLADYFAWVKDGATVDSVASQNIQSLVLLDDVEAVVSPNADAPQRILFVRTDSIGDAVLASSMLAPISRRYPSAQLAVFCQQHIAELYAASPFVHAVICYERESVETDSGREEISNDIAQFNPDLILNSVRSRDALSETLTHAFPSARRVGIESDLNNTDLAARDQAAKQYDQIILSAGDLKPELTHHAEFLRGLGISSRQLQPVVWTTEDDEHLAEAFFTQHGLDPLRTMAVFPFTQHGIKNYPVFAPALAEFVGWNFLVLGGAESDAGCEELTRALPGPAFNLAGRTSLLEMAALIRRCRILVGSDSCGPHIACAVGVPNVVVLGGGHLGRFFPYSPLTSVVALPLPCSGCNWACKFPTPHCVTDITPDFVTNVIRQSLESNAASARVFLHPSDKSSLIEGGAAKFFAKSNAEIIEAASSSASAAHPLVSVLVSTYASEKYLRACLEDLEAQTIADKIEIIVIDSGSPENERAIVEEFQKRYTNIRYVRTERETLYASWNRGVEIARGKYVTNANADDSHRADALELLVGALEANPAADLSYGDYFTTLVPNDTFAAPSPLRLNQHPPYHPALLHFYCVTGCHPMWRRTVFDKIGLFDPQYTAPGDYEFLLRFAAHGLRAVHVPQPLSLFYQNQEGLSFKSRARSEREFKAIQTKYRAEIPIERLFRVDPTDAAFIARGWTALGNLAMSYEAPWFDNACQDFPFALHCYQTALRHDSENTAARFNLVITTALHEPAKLERTLLQLPPEELRRAKKAIASGWLELIAVEVPPAVEPLEYGRAVSSRMGGTGDSPVPPSPISPVRFLGAFFDSTEAASAARTLVPKLASKVTLGTLDRSVYSEAIGASMLAADREVLRETFRRYPFLRGGVTISHGAAIDFQVPADTSLRVGWTSCPFARVPERWVMACQQMDEVWVPSAFQLEAFVASGVPRTRLAVMPTPVNDDAFGHSPGHVADLVVARLRQLERGMTSIELPDCRAEGMVVDAPVTIAWEGTFRDLGSLSHVNRELTRQLATQTNVRLSCVGLDEPSRGKSTADITVRHEWPPRWQRPASGAWVLIQPWEFGALPAEWVRELKNVDEVWAPSEYVRRVYLDSGVPAGKVKVMPNGIDPERFHPNAAPLALPTRKQFKFLFVGGTIQRKGPDVLLETFLARFTADDDVCLVIKDFGGQGVYAGQTIAEQIRAAQQKPGAPEIIYLTDDLSAEQVAGLYTACDCLVHPYRGEGFALPVLEAMACGLPVIVTAGGATDDFATDEWAYRIAALRKPITGSIAGIPLAGRGWWLEPDAEALGEQMCWVTAHRDAARAKGRAASDYVRREWTWAKSAKIAAQLARDFKLRQSSVVETATVEKTSPVIAPREATVRAVAKLGELVHAQELLGDGSHLEAWKETLNALRVRPFHPAAWLLLAEIALAAGDGAQARRCAERARALAPLWKPAKQFLSRSLKDNTPVEWPNLPAESSSPRLSVCLITKNEERFLGRCLASIQNVADQIVVVDTGSTDRTIEIAREHGADIHEFTWCDDFSAARNAALAHATGDWVLILDADEELSADSVEKLRRDIQDSAVMAYRLPIVDVGREKEGCHYIPRLFRNAPGLYFAGRIHEQLFPSLEPLRRELGLENKLSTVTLLHHGYTDEVTKSRSKSERNLRLLRLAIEETPGDANLLMSLGLELTRSDKGHAGLEAYDQAWLALSAQPVEAVPAELRETLLMQYSTHLMRAGCWQQLLGLFETPQGRAADGNASLHFLRGMAAMKLNRWKHAAEQMRRCLSRRDQPSLTTIHADIRTVAPRHCLALSLTQTKDFDGATKAFADALREAPDNYAVQFDYAGFLFARGRDVDALQQLHQLAERKPEEVTVWQSGGKVALSRPEYLDVALDWTETAHRQFPTDAIVAVQRAEALLLGDRAAEALSLWREFHDPLDPRQVAACLICEITIGHRGPVVPMATQAGTAREVLLWFQRFVSHGAEEVIRNLSANLALLRERCPAAADQLEIIFAQAGTEAVAVLEPA